VNSSFMAYLEELEVEVERTRGIYEERFNELVETIRRGRKTSDR